MNLLGVRVDNFSKKEILEKIEQFLAKAEFHQIATVNAEFILEAQKNSDFKNILNACDLNVADGVSIKYAFLRWGKWLKCRWAGTDLMDEILYLAYKLNHPVYLAVNKFGLTTFEEIAEKLEKLYPMIEIYGADIDPCRQETWPKVEGSEILLCNFGAPIQEQFIDFAKNDTIRLAVGVGGSFDFVCKKVKRAPKIIRQLGLEWLFRLLFQSWRDKEFLRRRWHRVFNAVVVFPIKIILSKK